MNRTVVSRRALLVAGGCALCASGAAARVSSYAMNALVDPDYAPTDKDEKGLWQNLDRFEQDIAASNLLLKSPEMHDYTLGVMRRLLGKQADGLRLYILRDPGFNASMAPNGMMMVQTGALIRLRSEAQYAAVLGHESGHYLRKHSLASWRNREAKTGAMAFIAAGANVTAGAVALSGGAYSGSNARSIVDMANSINSGLALSLFSFSREQEMEADAFGVKLMDEAGYPPEAAPEVWHQFMDERRASAADRGKRYRDPARSAFSSHPPNDARMLDLADSAREIAAQNRPGHRYDDRREAWRQAMAPLRSTLLEEQVRLNDSGASLYLIDAMARDGWDGALDYWQGEVMRLRDLPGDADLANRNYAAAVGFPDAPAEAWRAQGYALIKAGQPDVGRQALARYLDLRPDAADAAMVRFSIAQ